MQKRCRGKSTPSPPSLPAHDSAHNSLIIRNNMAVLSAPYKVDQKVLVDTGVRGRKGAGTGVGAGVGTGVGQEQVEEQGLLWDARIVEIRAGE